jgi:large subunit ribosomal protein L18
MASFDNRFDRRKRRVRYSVKLRANGKLRLSVHRTGCHIYAQIIDDKLGKILVSASSLDASFKGAKTSNVEAASKVGQLIAKKAIENNIKEVVFDRGGFIFHGRVKAVADGARTAGLVF